MKYALPVLLLTAFLATPAVAETAYVTDQWSIALRADATPGAPAVKTLTTGAVLEVLERGEGIVRVRDAQGIEGWIEASALSTQPPASGQVRSLRAELERTRAQLVQAQAQIDKSRAAAPPAAALEPLQAELNATRQQLAQTQGELKKKEEELASLVAAPTSAPEAPTVVVREGAFSFLWVGIAFAMLVVGFIGGMVWVKEGIRRRMGGLYLRI